MFALVGRVGKCLLSLLLKLHNDDMKKPGYLPNRLNFYGDPADTTDVRFRYFKDDKPLEIIHDQACFMTVWTTKHPKGANRIRFYPHWSECTKAELETFYKSLMGYFFFKDFVLNSSSAIKDKYFELSLEGSNTRNSFSLLSTLCFLRYPDECPPVIKIYLKFLKKYPKNHAWMLFYRANLAAIEENGYLNTNHMLWGSAKIWKNQKKMMEPNFPKYDEKQLARSFKEHCIHPLSSIWNSKKGK